MRVATDHSISSHPSFGHDIPFFCDAFPYSVAIILIIYLLNWYSRLRASQSLPANTGDLKRTQVRSLGQEDPLQEGTATQSSILA